MDPIKTKAVLEASRNGANEFYRHPFNRRLVYTDGVKELAGLGCFWILDILATEGVSAILSDEHAKHGALVILHLTVSERKGRIDLVSGDDEPAFYTRLLEYTDAPEGGFDLWMQYDGDFVTVLLPSEY